METRQHADTFVINSPGIKYKLCKMGYSVRGNDSYYIMNRLLRANANDTVQGRRST